MNLFQIFGTIAVKNQEANRAIDETADKAKEAAATLGDKFTTIGNKISGIGKAIAPVSAALAAALTVSTKSASDFQNGMAKMSTLFDTSKNSVNALGKEFLALSNKTGLSATELAEAGYQALSAGQSVETVGKFVETAGNLAKAGFTSTTTAVDVLTTAINAYGSEAGSAEQISNKLVRTQNLGKTTVDELASSMGKIIPTASSMGVNINNLTSGYVSLTKQGIATAEATTYMNSMFNELGDSGTTLGGIIKNKTGMSFQDCMRSGMSLADVLQITKQYADENGIAYNELWSSAEAGKASLAILNGGVEEFNKTVETMASDTNDVSEALNKLNTPSEKVHKVLNRIKNSGIELGNAFINALVPVLDSVCNIVERATTWFNNLDDSTKTLIASMMGIGAIASPLLIIGGKIISVVGSVISSISSLSGVLAALTSPIGIVIAAIAGLIAIFVVLYNTNEEFKNTVQTVWTTIKETISGVITAVQELIQAFIELIKNIWDAWGQDILNVVTTVFTAISNIINSVLNVIKGIIQTVTALIKGDWDGVWNGIKATVSAVWGLIKNIISGAVNTIKSVIQLGLNVIKTVFSTVWNSIKDIVTTVWNNIKSTITTVINAIKTVITTVFNAIKSTITSVLNTIKSTVSSVWDTIKSTVSTVVNSIQSTIDNVFNAIKSTITSILNSIKSTFSSVWNSIKSTVNSVINSIKSTISSGMNSAKSTVSSVLESIKSKFSSIFSSATSIVSDAINKIKGFFNFRWSLPPIKLPHFSISGSFSLMPPSVPTIGVSWYKKAMNEPYMFTRPTIFDVNPVTGQAKGAGEAGDEVMIGKETMLNMIRQAVASENKELIGVLKLILHAIYDLDEGLIEKLIYAFTNMQFQINDREFARLVRAVR